MEKISAWGQTCPLSCPNPHKQQPRIILQMCMSVNNLSNCWVSPSPWNTPVIKDSLLKAPLWLIYCCLLLITCISSSLEQDPAGFEVHILRGLVVIWGPAVWDAYWAVPFPWGRWRWTVWVHPSGHASLPTLDYQGIKRSIRKGRTDYQQVVTVLCVSRKGQM